MSSSRVSCAAQRFVAIETGGAQHRLDHRRIVLRHDPERVAGLEGQPGALERHFQMDRLLGRATAVEIDALGDLGRERIGFGVERSRRGRGEVDVDDVAAQNDRCRVRLGAPGQLLERAARPGRRRPVIVQVAIDPRRDALAAQRLETQIDAPPDLAEVDVAGIAEREHGKAHAIEARRVLGHERGIELGGALGRIALAPGARDHQEVALVRDLRRADLGHVEQLCGEALLARGLLEVGADALGIAQFGGVEDGERDPGAGRGGRRGERRAGGRGMVAGEKAAEPLPLLDVGARHDRIQRLDVLGRERRAVREQRQGRGHDHPPGAPAAWGSDWSMRRAGALC